MMRGAGPLLSSPKVAPAASAALFPIPLSLALLLLLLAVAPARSQSAILQAEFWTDLDMPPREGEAYPLPDQVAASRVLEEAAWVFSGMVAGFDFDWTPENKGRRVTESFSLSPAGSIAPGDPRLVPGATTRSWARLGAWISYRPDAADLLFLDSSRNAPWLPGQGQGAASRSGGFAARRSAYAAAAKAALEAWARSVEPQRPREIRGRLVFAEAPLVAVVENAWVVSARVRFEIVEIRRWSMF